LEHFADEEELQIESLYPNFGEHKNHHEAFVSDFIKINNRINSEGIGSEVIDMVKTMVHDWVVDHISVQDMEFGEYYNNLR
jgi:hemerythrin-like metal-binding protein